MSHTLYMWALLDVATGKLLQHYLFYKKVKYITIIRNDTVANLMRKWMKEEKQAFGLSPNSKGELLVRRDKQQGSQDFKDFLDGMVDDFNVILVDDAPSQGLPWAENLLENLCDPDKAMRNVKLFRKALTEVLTKEDVKDLRDARKEEATRYCLPTNGLITETEDEPEKEGLRAEIAQNG
ncbi:hypothetical protein COCOBI_pt-0880 (chloroplast) [Coccomyxa sp. Obi]|nr:hypothetical protein COCOBI_pt-0880 [Coccomyxa sp. Obi]